MIRNRAKQKQSVFTEVLVTYQITHAESGESINIMGYGHGQDSMDKSAGKATTYALKNALLYSFLVPTGTIDDTDATHSNNVQAPPKAKPVLSQADFERGMDKMEATAFKEFMEKYELTDIQEAALKLL